MSYDEDLWSYAGKDYHIVPKDGNTSINNGQYNTFAERCRVILGGSGKSNVVTATSGETIRTGSILIT